MVDFKKKPKTILFCILIVVLNSCNSEFTNSLALKSLKCEYLQNPEGIDVEFPRFSWITESDGFSVFQKAYHLKVWNVENNLVWDSGKTNSEESVNIPYSGKPLQSLNKYFWQIKIWDNNGNESEWSESAHFSTGFLNGETFSAKWIKNPDKSIRSPLFRKDFEVFGKIKSAKIYTSAIGLFEMHLNGEKVNNHFFEPNTSQFTERLLYTTYDITDQIQQGKNAIGLWMGEGQSAFTVPPEGRFANKNMKVSPFDRPMALIELHLVLDNDSVIKILSDETWKTTTSPITYNNYFGGEDYDARLENNIWCDAQTDHSSWDNVIFGKYDGEIAAQIIPPVRIAQSFRVTDSIRRDKFTVDYDFGTTVGGFWEIEVEGEKGTEVIVRGSEKCGDNSSQQKLSVDNKLNWTDNHTGKYYYKNCYSKYILKGDGIETYEPRFFYHGFRYLQVKVSDPEKVKIKAIRIHQLRNDVSKTGSFECSNLDLNRMHNIVIQTFGNNLLHGVPLSNPNSEKYGWTGDVHLFAEAAGYSFKTASFWTKWLRDFQDNQKWNGGSGYISVVVPELRKNPPVKDVSWLAAYPILLSEMLRSNNDVRIIKQHFSAVKKWFYFMYNETENNISSGIWGDHMIPGDNKKSMGATRSMAKLINTAYLYRVSLLMVELAKVAENNSQEYFEISEKIKAAFHREFYQPQKNYFMENESPEYFHYELAANLIALQSGIVADTLVSKVSDFVKNYIENNNYKASTGILGTKAWIDWFQKTDIELLYKIIKQKEYPGYIHMLDLGASTLNQQWNGTGDYNHCMLGGINEFFYNNLLGIQPELQNKKIKIKPFIPDDIGFAKGGIQTIYGKVAVAWKKDNGKLLFEFEIPVNVTAQIVLPATDKQKVLFNGKKVEKDMNLNRTKSELSIETGSGKYKIEVN